MIVGDFRYLLDQRGSMREPLHTQPPPLRIYETIIILRISYRIPCCVIRRGRHDRAGRVMCHTKRDVSDSIKGNGHIGSNYH